MNGTDGFLDIHDSHLRVLDGNIHAKSIILDQLDITSSNTTSSTVQFLNGVTAFKTTANVEIGTANLFVDTSTSNVGILTSTPTHTLDVRGTANVEVLRTSSNIEMNGGTFSLGGHMIPSANEQYDIGSAEYKIRDMYVSDNSLWIGDKAKISFDTTEDKLTFRKRKVSDTFIPAKIIDLAIAGEIGDDTTAITNDILGKEYTPGNLGAMKLHHWLQYAKEFQPNIKLSDIFTSTNISDYDSTSTAEGSFSGTGALTLPSGTTAEQPTGVTGMIRFNSTTTRLEVYNGTAWQSVGGVSATQSADSGTTTTNGGYKIHAFTSSGSLNVINGGYMDVLIVAGGGGGGGGTNSGGGGAGGVLLAQDLSIGDGPYNITVGDGGAAPYANGTNGSSSSFGPAYSANGGGGGGEYRSDGLTGGNGGGAGADDRSISRSGGGVTTGSTPSGFTKYGHSGGGGINGTSSNRAGGGGGGAGGDGGQANGGTAGSGGAGIDLSAMFGTTLGESGYFASGGHGQSRVVNNTNNSGSIYAGPVGGGGGNVSSRAGLPNTGGGGHGGYMDDPTNTGVGGSGIVIIRYLL